MMHRSKSPLFGRRFLIFSLSAVFVFILVIPLAVVLYNNNLLTPGIIILLTSAILLVYIRFSYISLFIELFTAAAAGLIFWLLDLTSPEWYLTAGITLGTVFCIMGLHAWYLEKRRE
jgi:predicted membrane-bound mannosyltransferase